MWIISPPGTLAVIDNNSDGRLMMMRIDFISGDVMRDLYIYSNYGPDLK